MESHKRSQIKHNTSRFFLRRLRSGALLLVKHGPLDERGRSASNSPPTSPTTTAKPGKAAS